MRGVPQVSVVVPTYRSSAYIAECLTSVRNQSLYELECIVVDDGSPENEAEIVAEIAAVDPRIRLIRHGANRGLSAARNTGLEAARGEFIQFLDADDILLPRALEIQSGLAGRNGTDLVRTSGELWHGAERTRVPFQHVPYFWARVAPESTVWLHTTGQVAALLIRREVLVRGNVRFDLNFPVGEDVEFFTRLFAHSKWASLAPVVTFLYRWGHHSMSNQASRTLRQWQSYGEYQRQVATNLGDRREIRAFMALGSLGPNAYHLTRLMAQVPPAGLKDVLRALMELYAGLDPDLAHRISDQPFDVPLEVEPYLHPLLRALVGQRGDELLAAIHDLRSGALNEGVVQILLERQAGRSERADELTVELYSRQPRDPHAAYHYGKLLLQRQDKRAAEVLGYAHESSGLLIQATLALVEALRREKQYDEAIAAVRRALARLPQSPSLLGCLAQLYKATGNSEARLSALRQACAAAPRDPARRERLIEALLDAGRRDDAELEIAGFAGQGGHHWRERLLATAEWRSGALGTAAARLQSLVGASDNCDLLAVRAYADILLELGHQERALEALETAAYHEHGAPNYRLKYAETARKLGRFSDAFAVLSEVVGPATQAALPNRAALKALFSLLNERPELGDPTLFLTSRAHQIASVPSLLPQVAEIARRAPESGPLALAARSILEPAKLSDSQLQL